AAPRSRLADHGMARLCAPALDSVRVCLVFCLSHLGPRDLHSFPTRRSSDLWRPAAACCGPSCANRRSCSARRCWPSTSASPRRRSEEHTSELQSRGHIVCRPLLEKKKNRTAPTTATPSRGLSTASPPT